MAKPTTKNKPLTSIVLLNMNGLRGRMLKQPPAGRKNRSMLVIGGQHTSLEYWQPLVEQLSRYGQVTMPDVPGFGGMTSFYRIDQQPSLDMMADYLAAFIKLRYKRKTVTLIGLDFGFVMLTRMLQRYPDLHRQVDLVVAYGGINHWRDLDRGQFRRQWEKLWNWFWGRTWPARFFQNVGLHPWLIRGRYSRWLARMDNNLDRSSRHRLVNQAIRLWHSNDLRTHFWSCAELLRLDNCQQAIPLPLVYLKFADRLTDTFQLEQHLQVTYRKVTMHQLPLSRGQLTIALQTGRLNGLIPAGLRHRLAKSPATIAKQ